MSSRMSWSCQSCSRDVVRENTNLSAFKSWMDTRFAAFSSRIALIVVDNILECPGRRPFKLGKVGIDRGICLILNDCELLLGGFTMFPLLESAFEVSTSHLETYQFHLPSLGIRVSAQG